DKALMHLVDGRLKLFEGAFSMARVSFNRSNRLAGCRSDPTYDLTRKRTVGKNLRRDTHYE
ncbi:MAG: hypothetical protein R6V07_03975, partial [Armatimonadota bacterium]